MPRPANRSSILPMATTGRPAAVSWSSSVGAERDQGEVAAVRGPAEGARRADERARDDPPDSQADPRELVRDLAPSIQLRDRHDVLVRGDLEHAVGRRVDDRLAGAQVLRAELLDDGRAATPPCSPSVLRPMRRSNSSMSSAGKPVGKHGKRPLEDEPHQLPVPGDRVLAGRRFRHAAEGAERIRLWSDAVDGRDPGEAETAQVRHRERDAARDVAQRVAAGVAVVARRRAARRCRRCR